GFGSASRSLIKRHVASEWELHWTNRPTINAGRCNTHEKSAVEAYVSGLSRLFKLRVSEMKLSRGHETQLR
ncbi:MAG: hypothetical protein ACI9B8_000718, partial [Sulfitobacter sp.]